MSNIMKILRSLTPGNRPSGHTYGELYVNTADGQLGVVNSSNQNQDLIGVPIFSQGATYQFGAVVYQLGVLYQAIAPVGPGAFNASQWSALAGAQGASYDCGRLVFVSATALSFKPFRGNFIKLNSRLRMIPNAGIAGLANTNVFVSGVAGQNLAASTNYYIFVFDNSGVLTADFWPLATTTHGQSATLGNEGVEVKFVGGTEDPTRSLIGMCRANASAQFFDDGQGQVGVASWFNKRNRFLGGNNGGTITGITYTSPTPLGGGQLGVCMWAGEYTQVWSSGVGLIDTAGNTLLYEVQVNNNTSQQILTPAARIVADVNTASQFMSMTGISIGGPALGYLNEGFNTFNHVAWVSAGVGSLNMTIGGVAHI